MIDSLNREEVVRCLKEANIYEENMSEDLMSNFYRAIKNSENSLKEELERVEDIAEKSLNESANEFVNGSANEDQSSDEEYSVDADCKVVLMPLDNSIERHIENEKNNCTEMVIDDKTESLDTKTEEETPIGFNDMPQSDTEYPLTVINHPLKYVNIQNSNQFLTSDSEIIHDSRSNSSTEHCRLTKKLAPLEPPIKLTRNNLSKISAIQSLEGEDQPPDTYVCRSRRLTTRKVYKSEKGKSDGEWVSKKSSKTKPGNANTHVSRPRTYHRQPTNEEVMSRSSQLLVEEMEKFANSLMMESKSLDDDNTDCIIIQDDEKAFERRRVIPPRPTARKSIQSRNKPVTTRVTSLNIITKSTEIEESSTVEPVKNNPVSRKLLRNIESVASTSSSSVTTPRLSKQQMNMVQCPLCTVFFHQKKIEEHASTCGEETFNHDNQEMITCEICDTIFPLTTSYEVHVKECIAKQNGF